MLKRYSSTAPIPFLSIPFPSIPFPSVPLPSVPSGLSVISVISVLSAMSFASPVAIGATPQPISAPALTPESGAVNASATRPAGLSPTMVNTPTPALAQALPVLDFLGQMAHGNNVNAISFSNNGQRLASTGGDRFIRIWQVDSVLAGDDDRFVPIAIAVPESDGYVTSMIFAPGDRYLVTGTFNGNVRVWDLQNCDPDPDIYICASNLLLNQDYTGVAPVVRFSPNGQLLAASNYDGTVTLWDWGRQQVVSILEAETGAHDGRSMEGRFSSLSFSPDGQFLAAGSHNTTITVWTLEAFERVGVIETGNGVDSVAFSPDSQWLASGNLFGMEMRSLRVSRGRLKIDDEIQMDGLGRVNTLTFDATGQVVLGGDNHNNIVAWDLEEEELLTVVPPQHQHDRPVLEITHSSDRRLMASSSTDGVIKLWQMY